MRASSLLSAMTLSVGLAAGGAALAPAFAQAGKSAPGIEARQGMSIPQIHEKLTALGYWNIDKIERDPGAFEVRANEKNGDRVKLYLDVRTGEIIDRRLEGRKRDLYDRHDRDVGKRNSVDCNERRCRDDLPRNGAASPPKGR